MDVESILVKAILRKITFIIGMSIAQLISFYIQTYLFSSFDLMSQSISFRFDIWNMPSNEFYAALYWFLIWNIVSGFLFFVCLVFIFENFKPFMKLVFYLIIIGQIIFFMWSMSVSWNFGLSMAVMALPPTFAALTRLRGYW
jgi:hypothetical protein